MSEPIDSAKTMLDLAKQLAESPHVQARRAGQRSEAILRDLLYELDPWGDALSQHAPPAAPPHPLPYPIPTEENRGHWEAARRHELRLQVCLECGFLRFPIASNCPKCLSFKMEWKLLTGRGKVSTWIRMHKAYWPGMKERLPYVVAQIELDEGPRYTSNLDIAEGETPEVGMRVEVFFDDVANNLTLPKFRPLKGA